MEELLKMKIIFEEMKKIFNIKVMVITAVIFAFMYYFLVDGTINNSKVLIR